VYIHLKTAIKDKVAGLATPIIMNRAEVMLNERLGIIETVLPASGNDIHRSPDVGLK
jgi:hypothetical protein